MALREIEKPDEVLVFAPAFILLVIGVFYLFSAGLVTWNDVKETFGLGDSNVVKTIPADDNGNNGAYQTTTVRTLPKD